MDDLARKLISDTYEEFTKDIVVFIKNYEDRTKTEMIQDSQLRKQIWKKLFEYLAKSEYASVHFNCLSSLRILSRNKTDLDNIITPEMVTLLLQLAELLCKNNEEQVSSTNVSIESTKVLCNVLYHSIKARELALVQICLQNLIKRIHNYTTNTSQEMKLFDVKMLFIITALNAPTRNTVKNLNGDSCLLNILDELFEQYKSKAVFSPKNDDLMLACDILKVLFNVYINSENSMAESQEKNKRLSIVLYKFLHNINWSKNDDLVSNIINLFTVISLDNYKHMIKSIENNEKNIIYQNTDVTTVSVILEFLDQRLNYKENLLENLSPVVTVLIRLVKADKPIRKYVKLQVLPPLKDVMKRPEEGTTLKAKLCKLLTSPITELRDLVAEFLFILCKENVGRMVKYTGYGNAAGMFANKGLLGRNHEKILSSSDSEDSDTEEYLKYKEQINPVTGCYEKAKPNPLEGISEEQKEYEALQLARLFDQLTRGGIVQPCRVGEDGKPKPIEHVLELQNELKKQQYRRESDSD